MASASLSVAYVGALLKSLLENGLVGDPVTALIGDITCSIVAPDRIETGSTEQARLNLFLHQVQANTSLRGRGVLQPEAGFRDPPTVPLVLDLYYLLTAYGSQELQPELLIGYATQQFHRARELTFRDGMWVGAASAEQPDLRIRPLPSLGSAAIQRITIQPHFLGGEELSRIWSALQARYRPSVSYRVVLELHPEQAGVDASHHDQHRRHN